MEDNSWIKLYRKFSDWEWYGDKNVKVLFLHLLLKVNYKEKSWKGIKIGRGQLVTSKKHLSEELDLSIQQVRTALKKLETTKDITIKPTNKYSLITIENFQKYQSAINENNMPIDNQITDVKQTDNKQLTITKENKNNKKEIKKENIYNAINDYTSNEELRKELKNYLDMRMQKQSTITKRAVEILLQNLEKLTANIFDPNLKEKTKIEIVRTKHCKRLE